MEDQAHQGSVSYSYFEPLEHGAREESRMLKECLGGEQISFAITCTLAQIRASAVPWMPDDCIEAN